MKRTLLTGLLTLLPLGALSAQTPVEAGVAVRMDLDEIVDRAGLVVSARVVAARVVEGPRGRIDTLYTLAVDRTFWGQDLPERVVRMPGGVLPDGRGMMIPGMARLALGEEVVLALSSKGDDGARVPVGLAQGKFSILTTPEGERVARRTQAGLELLRPSTGVVEPAEAQETMPYAELAARLETAVAKKRARLQEERGR